MKVLVHINHPAHVHLFRNLIKNLKLNDHEVIVTSIEKEMTLKLLEQYKIDYILVGNHSISLTGKFKKQIKLIGEIHKLCKINKPDVLLGLASMPISIVGKILDIRTIILDDTEHDPTVQLYQYLVSSILTPDCFELNLGPKNVRYPGYHELAYLHPSNFKPDKSILESLKVNQDEKFTIMRFVSWKSAYHDSGQSGLSLEMKKLAVKELSRYSKVFITSEKQLPKSLEKYRVEIPQSKIHDALYFSSLYFGDGGTMASESAVLGVPAIFVSSLTTGYLNEAENKYQLIERHHSTDTGFSNALSKCIEILKNNKSKELWKSKKDSFLKDKIDVTKYLFNFIVEGKPRHI